MFLCAGHAKEATTKTSSMSGAGGGGGGAIIQSLILGAFVVFKGFETTCLAYLHSRKFTLQATLKKCQVSASAR